MGRKNTFTYTLLAAQDGASCIILDRLSLPNFFSLLSLIAVILGIAV